MLIEILLSLIIASVLSVLAVRITVNPVRQGFSVTESAANTFTTAPIELPGVTSVQVRTSGGVDKVIGSEIMGIVDEMDVPSIEAGQNNAIQAQIVEGAAPTGLLTINNNLTLHHRNIESRGLQVTAVGLQWMWQESVLYHDLTDHDGNGIIVVDPEIHVSINGSGNAEGKVYRGKLIYHLVQIDSDELIAQILSRQN